MTNTNGDNGNDNVWWNRALRESVGLGVAEFASAAVSIGAFTFADEIAPNMMKKASKVVSKICVEPFLDSIEWGLQNLCKLKECQPDFSKSRQERAEQYAHYLSLFTVSMIPAVVTELYGRKLMNRVFHVDNSLKLNAHDGWIVGIDKGVQVGAIVGVNTIGAKAADAGIEGVTTILQKTLGWSEARSKRAAEALIIWHLGDFAGFAAAAGLIFHHQYKSR